VTPAAAWLAGLLLASTTLAPAPTPSGAQAVGSASVAPAAPHLAPARDAALLRRNLAVPTVAPPARLDSLLAAEQDLPAPARVGRWARRFLAWGQAEYRFGPAAGGYVAEGRLVPGRTQDCISLLYRLTELALATDARDAVHLALARRFAGASPDSVVGPDGRVDYDHPAHLDYSLDMIRSGLWGRDVTADLSGARPDGHATPRYPAGSYRWVPGLLLRPEELREGDIAWFVLDPLDPAASALRRDHGLVIGHVGVVIRDGGVPWLVHAASRPLPGFYDAPGIVRVPLAAYLERVDRYGGVIVTRLAGR